MHRTSTEPVRRVRDRAREQAQVVLFTVGASTLLALLLGAVGVVGR